METKETINLKTVVLIVFFLIVIELLLSHVLQGLINKTIIIIGLIRISQVISVLLILYMRNDTGLFSGFKKDDVFHGLKRGLVWSFGFGVCVIIAGICLYVSGADPFQMFRANPSTKLQDVLLLYGVGSLIAPIADFIKEMSEK